MAYCDHRRSATATGKKTTSQSIWSMLLGQQFGCIKRLYLRGLRTSLLKHLAVAGSVGSEKPYTSYYVASECFAGATVSMSYLVEPRYTGNHSS